MSFTVIPLHNLDLPADTRIAFGTEFNLEPVPAWLKKDENWLNNLSRHDRQSVLDARFALVSEYKPLRLASPIQNGRARSREAFRNSGFKPQFWQISACGPCSLQPYASRMVSMH